MRLIIILLLMSFCAHSKINVVTTTANIASLVSEVGKDRVEVLSLCKGTQDPHFLEAKPSYTFKLSKADLLISVGAGLEVGWLPLIIRGSRNPKLRVGQSSHLVITDSVELIDELNTSVSRAMGDVHPEGNPHIMVSPMLTSQLAMTIANKLSEFDKSSKDFYIKNAKTYAASIAAKMKIWKEKKISGEKVVSYHKTLSYFYKDFGIINVDVLEPKPGVPPTASHIIKLIQKMKDQNIKKIIVENYFDDAVAKRIKKDIPDVVIEKVAVSVHGKKKITNLYELYDHLVLAVGN